MKSTANISQGTAKRLRDLKEELRGEDTRFKSVDVVINFLVDYYKNKGGGKV